MTTSPATLWTSTFITVYTPAVLTTGFKSKLRMLGKYTTLAWLVCHCTFPMFVICLDMTWVATKTLTTTVSSPINSMTSTTTVTSTTISTSTNLKSIYVPITMTSTTTYTTSISSPFFSTFQSTLFFYKTYVVTITVPSTIKIFSTITLTSYGPAITTYALSTLSTVYSSFVFTASTSIAG